MHQDHIPVLKSPLAPKNQALTNVCIPSLRFKSFFFKGHCR